MRQRGLSLLSSLACEDASSIIILPVLDPYSGRSPKALFPLSTQGRLAHTIELVRTYLARNGAAEPWQPSPAPDSKPFESETFATAGTSNLWLVILYFASRRSGREGI